MRRRDALRAGAGVLGAGVLGGVVTGRGVGGGTGGNGVVEDTAADGYDPLGVVELADTREAVVSDDGRTAYLAVNDGYATVDVSNPAAPTVLAERRGPVDGRGSEPFSYAQDVAVSGDTMVLVGPAHPGIESPHGVLVVDVSDRSDPAPTGFYETDFPIHNAALDGTTAYLTSTAEGNPLVVVDVAAMEELARWSLFERDGSWSDVPSPLRTLHDVTVVDGVAALAYWDAGTSLLDVSDPSAPSYLGGVPAGSPADLKNAQPVDAVVPPGNHHFSLLAPGGDLLAVGRETWAVRNDGDLVGAPSGVTLHDVSDPSDPRTLSTIEPPSAADPTFRGTWTTAHNLDIREGTLYTSWYQGGVKRHDVSDPANPVEETWWVDPATTRFWTAVLAVPGEFFVAPSMGTRDGAPAGLWTFADAPGTGGDPEALTATPTPSGNTTATTVEPTRTPADSQSPTATGTSGGDDTEGATGTPSRAAGPGFGVAGALGALGAGTALALCRHRGGGRDDDRE